jgi:hypothetical protein
VSTSRRRLLYQFYITILTTESAFALEFEHSGTSIYDVKDRIQQMKRISPDLQQLVYNGRQLEEGRTLFDYNIGKAHIIFLDIRRESFSPWRGDSNPRMTIAPGGFISSSLSRDPMPGQWCGEPAHTVNLQVVNCEEFTKITSLSPKVPSPDKIAQIRLRRSEREESNTAADEEIHLRGIGEIYNATGINIVGPYDVERPREDPAAAKRSLSWRQMLFCGLR